MAIFIDPPTWPAHGTTFSHLISDTSLDELHRVARAAEISPRAFDGDHYDVPAHRYQDLVALGAQEVSSAELVRRLVLSGMRIPAKFRPSKINRVLQQRFAKLFPDHSELDRDPIVDELLVRWSEPHRHYHDRTHLLAVLNAIDLLERRGESLGSYPRAVRLAAWFHDAVYLADQSRPPGQDEEDSAVLAENLLSDFGLPDAEVEETARLVRLTVHHLADDADVAGQAFSDADLEVLGRGAPYYRRYVEAIKREYAHVPTELFVAGRAKILRALLESHRLFGTATAHGLWEAQARINLTTELDESLRF